VKRLTAPALLAFVVLVTGSLSASAASHSYVADRAHSEVGFNIRHFFNKTHGRFNDYDLALEYDPANLVASTVTVTIRDSSIYTGNDHRDQDLRGNEFFWTEKYPLVTFKSTKVIPGKDSTHFQVAGDLTIRDVTKPVTLNVEYLGGGPIGMAGKVHMEAGFLASTTINRKEYGILWNRTMDQGGVVLGDDAEIVLNIAARERMQGPPPGQAPPVAKEGGKK
jgi:polyisoprenoid-binding protein YceI